MEIKDWILVFGPLVGVIVGGGLALLGQRIDRRFKQRTELTKYTIDRLEEAQRLLGDARTLCYHLPIQLREISQKEEDTDSLARRWDVLHYDLNRLLFPMVSSMALLAPELTKVWEGVRKKLFRLSAASRDLLANAKGYGWPAEKVEKELWVVDELAKQTAFAIAALENCLTAAIVAELRPGRNSKATLVELAGEMAEVEGDIDISS